MKPLTMAIAKIALIIEKITDSLDFKSTFQYMTYFIIISTHIFMLMYICGRETFRRRWADDQCSCLGWDITRMKPKQYDKVDSKFSPHLKLHANGRNSQHCYQLLIQQMLDGDGSANGRYNSQQSMDMHSGVDTTNRTS